MRIVSVNLRKRLPVIGKIVEFWLDGLQCDLLVVQEPWHRKRVRPIELKGYRSLGGNTSVHSWLKSDNRQPRCSTLSTCWQAIDFGSFRIYNVYLPAKSRAGRISTLSRLTRDVGRGERQPLIVLGDFNLAPTPEDGIYADTISKFTSRSERDAFANLVHSARLLDMTSRECLGHIEYSFQPRAGRSKLSFRCDLALVSQAAAPLTSVRYDHQVREGPQAFTDHSALIVMTFLE